VNLKQRLTSTENLLRSIRSGEVLSSPDSSETKPLQAAGQGSIWTRRISLREAFGALARRGKSAQPAPSTPATAQPDAKACTLAPKPFWTRQLRFRRSGKSHSIGVSTSGPFLCLAVVRASTGAIVAARRFPMAPEQAPGEAGFPALLRASMAALGSAGTNADIWAVLRSSDLDLNVLAVPRLSGARLDAAVYWTLQKEKKFAEAEYVLDYLPMGPTAESKEPRLDVLTCLARRADVERLRGAFRDAGYPLTGITAIPNALLALYRQPGAPKGYTLAANIHVEPDFSAIGLYTQERLVFSRFIRSGAGSMAETLLDYYNELAKPRSVPSMDLELPLPEPAQAEEANAAPASGEALAPLDATQAQTLLHHVLAGAPKPDFATPAHLLSPQQMLSIIAPAIERLARQVERTLEYYASSQQARCDALHLSGEIFASPAIGQALAAQLGFTPLIFDATALVCSGQDLIPASERMGMTPALAAALSPADKGINLLSNYKVRTAQDAKRRVTSGIVLGLAGLMLLIGGAGFVLEHANTVKRKELEGLKARLAVMGPEANEDILKASLSQYVQRQNGLRQAAARLLAPAAMAEIARRAPENVKILSLTAEYPAQEAAKPGSPPLPGQPKAPAQPQGQKETSGDHGVIVLEGVVTGDKVGFDSSLSRFILDMQSSPLFAMPMVNETGLKELGTGGQVLYFVMRVGVK